MDQSRLTTDGIHFDSIEGQAWKKRVFQERLYKMKFELFDTGVLNEEETTNEPAFSTFVPANLETCLGAVPAVIYRPQSSSEPGQRTKVLDHLGESQKEEVFNHGEDRDLSARLRRQQVLRDRKRDRKPDRRPDRRLRVPAEKNDDQREAL